MSIVHEDWVECPRCCDQDRPQPECWMCEGEGWVERSPKTDRAKYAPECPKCGAPCEHRGPSHERGESLYCDDCGEVFHIARGWPDIRDHLTDR